MKKRIVLLAMLWLLVLIAADSHVYPDGWYWNLPAGHWCGVEIAPTPGVFCDVA